MTTRGLFYACILTVLVTIPVRAEVSTKLDNGALQLRTPAGVVLDDIRLYMQSKRGTFGGEWEPAGSEEGSDRAGAYRIERFRLKAEGTPKLAEPVQATLELRRYLKPEVIVATLQYDGPAPDAEAGIKVGMRFPEFGRGMAIHRYKLWWTAPSFVSDPRQLPGANLSLLWQRMGSDDYHLLVPLAGDGMMGELGVEPYDYFRVALSSYAPSFIPYRVPLFAYASSGDPYRLAPSVYTAAFAANAYYGRLRWEKPYPEIYRYLGWSSWNTYYQDVTEERVLTSVRSLREKQVPLGFVLVDDGWLSARNEKLTAYEADPVKFAHGLAGLVRTLHEDYKIPHVGVWHAFEGYWEGVDPDSEIGRRHKLFAGDGGRYLPDPRKNAGESFYSDWYRLLKQAGIEFIKVDNQGSLPRFTDGLLPLFASGEGEQRNLQESARRYFPASASEGPSFSEGVSVLNCMAMSLEDAYNWRYSNLARNSDDYFPNVISDTKDHVFQNAYNNYWTANFAYPDWDMFETHHSHAEYQAIARAISGGPVYTTDSPGKEHAEILRGLALSDGRLLMPDEPAQVTRDVLLRDTSLEAAPLKVFASVSRPGYKAGMVAAFNVDKTASNVSGTIRTSDVEGLEAAAPVAVYQRSSGKVTLLNAQRPGLAVTLGEYGADLFSLVAVDHGAAVLGLLDKYLGPAAVVSVRNEGNALVVRIREAGEFGAYLEKPPASVRVGSKNLPVAAYRHDSGLLKIPAASFSDVKGEVEIRITM